jgi:fatty-acyl-CoA synthase
MRSNPFKSDWLDTQAHGGAKPKGTLSYVVGASAPALEFTTIPEFFKRCVSEHGSHDAAVFDSENLRLTWYELSARVDRLAAGLLAMGLRKGNRIGIWAPNRHEWLVTQFATARIGLVLVNINPAYRQSELEYALKKVGCRALIMARSFKTGDYLGMLSAIMPELHLPGTKGVVDSVRLPDLKHVVLLDSGSVSEPVQVPQRCMSYAEVLAMAGPAHMARLDGLSAALDPDDAINIQFTSGTTGSPKGATLSHFNILNNARFCAAAMALVARDTLCIPVPLYHCFGMVLGVLCAVASGAKMVFPSEGFDALQTLQSVAKHRCTALHGVPTMFVAMLEHPEFGSVDLSSLRTGIMAGAPCPVETMRRITREMHMQQVTIAYGMTETAPISFQSDPGDTLERRISTVGRVQPHCEAKIIDRDGRIVPVGQSGELCTRGYAVMRGYWKDDTKTAEAIDPAGWMHTGDLAVLDNDGYLNIVGRVKDMLIRGGENIYPREVEEFLLRHPAVMQVQVFGVPDAQFGEEVAACVILRPDHALDAAALQAFCKDQIAYYKVPRYIEFVDAFPHTATGKPQKFALRASLIKKLGLSAPVTA